MVVRQPTTPRGLAQLPALLTQKHTLWARFSDHEQDQDQVSTRRLKNMRWKPLRRTGRVRGHAQVAVAGAAQERVTIFKRRCLIKQESAKFRE